MRRRSYVATLGAGMTSLIGFVAVGKPNWLLELGKGKSGNGEQVSVEKTITDDAITYLEKSDEVRYPIVYAGGEPQEYTTNKFKHWAKRKSAFVGSTAVLSAIEERLTIPVDGIGKSVGSRLFDTVIFVEYITPREANNYPPELTFQKVIDVTPRSVEATVVLEGEKYTRSVPVTVRKSNDGQPD